jgi:hypothetical protein
MLLGCLCAALALPAVDVPSGPATTAAEAARYEAAALQLLQANATPAQSVVAALAFTRALNFYRTHGDVDKVNELQANIYWCRKQMTLADVQAYVAAKTQDPSLAQVATDMEAAIPGAIPQDQAGVYFSRAEAFATANPKDFLRIAIRYFEVADRFQGTEVSLTAQRRSLEAQRQAAPAGSADRVAEELKALVPVPGDMPAQAVRILTEHNLAVTAVTGKASEEVAKQTKRTQELLAKEADTEQKRGNLATTVAIRQQMADLEQATPGVSKQAVAHVESYREAKAKLVERAQEGVTREQKKTLKALATAQSDETRKGNVAGALAIKAKSDEMSAVIAEVVATQQRLAAQRHILGAWNIAIQGDDGRYKAVWTFTADGRVLETQQTWDNESLADKEASYRIEEARVFISLPDPANWNAFNFPIDPKRTLGDSWKGNGRLTAVKKP